MFVKDETSASPVEDQVELPASAENDESAASSPLDAKKPEPSLLDVVKNAVAPDEAEAEDTSAPEAEKEGDADPEDAASEPTPEDPPADRLHRHARFKELVAEKNELRSKVETLQAPAEQYQRIEAFMQHNGLDNQAVVELFRVGALIRNDPEKAYEAIADTLVELAKITGRTLPADLTEDVEYGRISEERAAELSRERARATRLEATLTATGERQEAQQVQQTVQGVRAAVADWETRTRSSDPDFKVKEKLIADRVSAIAAQTGKPQTPEQAVTLIARAHREITTELKSVIPQRQAIGRGPSSSSSTAANPVPKTLLEAISVAARGPAG